MDGCLFSLVCVAASQPFPLPHPPHTSDETADEPGIPRFPNLTPVADPSLPQPAARASAPPPVAATDDGEGEAGGEGGANGGDEDVMDD